jgi:DNA-binding NtrC family response regulator
VIVDDDDGIVSVVTACLRDYRVSACIDPEDALAIVRTEPIDLLIADFLMPRMTGDELIRRARQVRPGLRVVIVTGYLAAVQETGVDDVRILEKPFTRQELLNAVTDQIAAMS